MAGTTEAPEAADLSELIDAAGPPEPPKDLGNFPATAESKPGEEPAAQPEAAPVEPLAAAAPAEPEDVEEPAPSSPLEERLARIERENEFLKLSLSQRAAAAPPPPQQSPLDTIRQFLPWQVSEQDVQTILTDPAKGAEYLQGAIYAAALGGANMALQQSRAEVAQQLGRQAQETSLRDRFWASNGDLDGVKDIVQMKTNEVWAEPIPRTDEEKLTEVGRRTRARCRELGIKLEGAAPTPPRKVAGRRIRPAMAEGASTSRGAAPSLSPFEKDLFQLVNSR
jgi:hypothetical protein